jgi:RHS repeat-associated protein
VNNPLPELALERNGSNALLRRYLYGSDLHSMETSATARFYYHQDGLGSVTNMTNSSGAKQWTYVWEPFGTKRTETKNAGSAPANMMRFAGEYMDTATSLYHLRARQYDTAIGRFLATDPITQPLSDPYASTYVYADNRPTVLVDPPVLILTGLIAVHSFRASARGQATRSQAAHTRRDVWRLRQLVGPAPASSCAAGRAFASS